VKIEGGGVYNITREVTHHTQSKKRLRMAACSSSTSSEEEITLKVKWSGKDYTVRVCADDTVGELKRRICESTNVLPIRQKLLYPKLASKLNDDSLLLSQLPINLNNSSLKFTMIGFAFLLF